MIIFGKVLYHTLYISNYILNYKQMGGIHSNKRINKTELKKLSAKTHFTEGQIKKWYKGFIVSCLFHSFYIYLYLSMYLSIGCFILLLV